MAFSRTGKSWKKATGPGKFWKVYGKRELTLRSWDCRVNVNIGALEKLI